MEDSQGQATVSARAGSRFGHYLLKRLLGRGGFGEVYEAFDTKKNRLVALKLLAPYYSADPGFRERLFREASNAGRLNEAHVVPIHDYGEIDSQLYIDMRLVRGIDLATVLAQSGRLTPARAVNVVCQIAAALDAAHDEQMIHRDVKPGNILLAHDDFACLVDFGLASAAGDAKMTSTGITIGTFAYLAPERLNQADVGPSADIYALACVLYECLTGSPPYTGDIPALISAHLAAPIPHPSLHSAGIPVELDSVVITGMAKNPQGRYRSAGEFASAAREALATEPDQLSRVKLQHSNGFHPSIAPQFAPAITYPTTTSAARTPPQNHSTRSRRLVVAIAAVATIAAVAAAAYVLVYPSPSQPSSRPQTGATAGTTSGPTARPSQLPTYGQQEELPFAGLDTRPRGVAVDLFGNIFVCNILGDEVLELAAGASAPTRVPFEGLFEPEGVAVDPGGGVYVADTINKRVLSLRRGSASAKVLPFADLGYVHGVTLDPSGRAIYAVAHDPARVLKLPVGSATSSVLPFNGLQEPWMVAVDASDDIYVADKLGDRVVKLRGDGSQVQLPFAGLKWPEGIALDGDGNVFVTDTLNNRVLKLESGSSTPTELPFTGLQNPSGIAVDGRGNVFVADGPYSQPGRLFRLPHLSR